MKAYYTKAIKKLLGVRESKPTINCLIELNLNTLKHFVVKRRQNFLKKKLENIDYDMPIHFMMRLCRGANTKEYKILMNSLNYVEDQDYLKNIVLNKSESHTKFLLYRSVMNPHFEKHDVSKNTKLYIPDSKDLPLPG